MRPRRALTPLVPLLALILCYALPADAGVVVNEIFYHAPNDLDDIQWLELHNAADEAADVSGYQLKGAAAFAFPGGTTIEPRGYVVVALNPGRLRQAYRDAKALGPLPKPMPRGGGVIELVDAAGKTVDTARYDDKAPWPVTPDGFSASLERICPSAPGDSPDNWAASPLPRVVPRPAGTIGKPNAAHSAAPPPVVKAVTATPADPTPAQPLRVEADVTTAPDALKSVSLLYRVVTDGVLGNEFTVSMARDGATGRYAASIPPQPSGTLVRYRVKAVGKDNAARLFPAEHDLRPTLSAYVHDKFPESKIPLAFVVHVRQRDGGPPVDLRSYGRGAPPQPKPPRGGSAFVYADPRTGKTELFDHVNVAQRDGDRGYKVYFHRDRTLNGMTTVSIIFEGSERFLLAEALAYDVYRRAGNAASLTEFVRLHVDGRPAGYHLLIEQPNRAFLRRHRLDDSGNLYKIDWSGGDLIGMHEKRTNEATGHDDLVAVVSALKKAAPDPDAQWKVIRENFNVEQVATYFAVNMVLSHWDGYFNNYLTYRDPKSGRWEMYPWDQDKTWGFYDGLGHDDVFTDLPLTNGMEGDVAPGGARGGSFGGGNVQWWRRGGAFSRPLLANPHFRKIFLARTAQILETVYTPEVYNPLIDATAERIRDDVRLRGRMYGRDAAASDQELARLVALLKRHLTERRAYLLAQPELKPNAATKPAQ
jgi:hypothetical protein